MGFMGFLSPDAAPWGIEPVGDVFWAGSGLVDLRVLREVVSVRTGIRPVFCQPVFYVDDEEEKGG